jgi:hypothetical protein
MPRIVKPPESSLVVEKQLLPDKALTALKARATKLLKAWHDVTVTDTPSFESASEGLKDAVSIRKDLKALPVYTELARQKADIKAKEKVLKDVDKTIATAEDAIRDALSAYAAAQRAAQEKLITKALDVGKDEKAAAIAAKPFVPAVEGLSFTEHRHAEVTSLYEFIAWLAGHTRKQFEDDKLEELVSPNLVTLNARVRLLKTEDIGIPGVKGVMETSSTVRT